VNEAAHPGGQVAFIHSSESINWLQSHKNRLGLSLHLRQNALETTSLIMLPGSE
jgi:hypothetical protein